MSQFRRQQIADQVKQALSTCLIMHLDVSLLKMVTLTQVIMTADLREAKVYFDYFDESLTPKDITDCLYAHKGEMRHFLAKDLQLRNIPKLIFHFDETRQVYEKAQELIAKDKETYQ